MLWSNECKVQGKILSHILKKSPIALTTERAVSILGSSTAIGNILNPKLSEDTQKKDKGEKTGASHDWGAFICRNIIG